MMQPRARSRRAKAHGASSRPRLHAGILTTQLTEHVALATKTTARRLLEAGLGAPRNDFDLLQHLHLLRSIDDLDLEIVGLVEDVIVRPLVRTERDVGVVTDLVRALD